MELTEDAAVLCDIINRQRFAKTREVAAKERNGEQVPSGKLDLFL